MDNWEIARHKKRGTNYLVIGEAEVQSSKPIKEGDKVVIYVDNNGKKWARPSSEFYDGRFDIIIGTEELEPKPGQSRIDYVNWAMDVISNKSIGPISFLFS
ncbi:MAG: hypothetical protein ACOCQD_02965 [archaeon]